MLAAQPKIPSEIKQLKLDTKQFSWLSLETRIVSRDELCARFMIPRNGRHSLLALDLHATQKEPSGTLRLRERFMVHADDSGRCDRIDAAPLKAFVAADALCDADEEAFICTRSTLLKAYCRSCNDPDDQDQQILVL